MYRLFFGSNEATPALELDTSAAFDYQNSKHVDVIKNRIARFKQAQAALYNFDNKILTGLTVGTVCWLGAAVPIPFLPTITISLGGFSYASYQLGRRPQSGLVEPYRNALTELIEVYKWSMSNKKNTWYKLGVPAIQDLILTLGPWVNQDTITVWSDEDLAPGKFTSRGLEPSDEFKAKLKEFETGVQTKNIWYSVYGQNGQDDLVVAASAYLKEITIEVAKKCAPEAMTTMLKRNS
ncbi:hypothetical protein [Legionella cardiaca]|uniref:Transmembrane protein n=1 Tax=Legionella cardiaca TaxID=1071983 RepID=A0ABY8ARF7_9GAMM|nr:hypothetical protein [Legionella cardiaca]WED42806.1 hypothetical protein PXX05_13025 [Legionella cardiaca]